MSVKFCFLNPHPPPLTKSTGSSDVTYKGGKYLTSEPTLLLLFNMNKNGHFECKFLFVILYSYYSFSLYAVW